MPVPTTERVLAYVILIVMAILVIVPVLAGSITAFKPQIIWVSSPPTWIFEPTLENFEFVIFTRKGWVYLRNSLIISVGSVAVALILGVPAAYAFARFRFRSSKALMQWLISLRMIPPIVVGLPFYAMFLYLERGLGIGLRDTFPGLIITYQTFLLPLVIWMMRGYFAELPAAMEESAMVEGYTRLGALWRVVLPVVFPGIVATAILNFIFAWNEFFLALILAGNRTSTLPMTAGTYIVRTRVEWGNLFAVNLIIMVPVIVLTIALRRQLVKGLTFGILE